MKNVYRSLLDVSYVFSYVLFKFLVSSFFLFFRLLAHQVIGIITIHLFGSYILNKTSTTNLMFWEKAKLKNVMLTKILNSIAFVLWITWYLSKKINNNIFVCMMGKLGRFIYKCMLCECCSVH